MTRSYKMPEQLVVFIGFYIFFLLTLAANLTASHDSIGYLNGIVKGHPLVHQHHLLYHYTAHYWLVFIQNFFPGIKDYYLLECFTALWGSGCLVIAYSFFRNRFHLPVLVSAIGTSIIAFGYGVWFYSVNIEVYAPPMFFVLLALYILTKENFNNRDVVKVIFCHALAILFHQINILFALIILYTFWQKRKSIQLAKSMMLYVVIGIVLVGGLYFYVGWVVEEQNTYAKFLRWVQGYTKEKNYWQPLSLRTPLHVLVGFSHAFIGGHYIFQLPFVNEYINNSLSSHSLNDELYLSRNISPAVAAILTFLTIVLAVLMLSLIIRFIRNYKSISAKHKTVINPLLICGGVYSLFFFFWMPEILEFWILQTVIVWILLIGALPIIKFPFKLNPVVGLVIISVLLLVVNFFGSIRWMLHLKNDWYYTKIEKVQNVVTPKDVILLQDGWILKDFLKYASKATIVDVPWKDSLRPGVDRAINNGIARQGKIYIYPEPNSKYQNPDTRYIDSISNVYSNRIKVFQPEAPRILVIE